MRPRCAETRKVVFATRDEAEGRLAEITADPRTPVIPRRVHNEACLFCGGWHLTHEEQRIPRRPVCHRGRRNRR